MLRTIRGCSCRGTSRRTTAARRSRWPARPASVTWSSPGRRAAVDADAVPDRRRGDARACSSRTAESAVEALPADALLIVPVSDAYISPSWYPSNAEHGKVVPTWNYEVVHLHGGSSRTTASGPSRWCATSPIITRPRCPTRGRSTMHRPTTSSGLLKAIVGVSLEVTRIDAKRKLSQNKATADSTAPSTG